MDRTPERNWEEERRQHRAQLQMTSPSDRHRRLAVNSNIPPPLQPFRDLHLPVGRGQSDNPFLVAQPGGSAAGGSDIVGSDAVALLRRWYADLPPLQPLGRGRRRGNPAPQLQRPILQLAPHIQQGVPAVGSATVAALYDQYAALPPLDQPAQLQPPILQPAPNPHHYHPPGNPVPQQQVPILQLAPPQHHHPPVFPAINAQQQPQLALPPAIPPPPVILPLAPPPAIAPPAVNAPPPAIPDPAAIPPLPLPVAQLPIGAASCGGQVSKT
ncbi:hypothetical protein BU17DRAFT_103047 [Hysterangium stoloniferum]|nr:hypothetical protein BU17DRAFT_103047 [Hysterangium stoloniferum]